MINRFNEEYKFLSNFYNKPIHYNGLNYRNSEAAFQAQKTLNPKVRLEFRKLNPGDARRYGRKVKLRDNWDRIKVGIMAEIVHQKFKQNPELIEKLLETQDEILIEGNTWHDNCFGDCICEECVDIKGENNLGKILMSEREYWRKSKWQDIK